MAEAPAAGEILEPAAAAATPLPRRGRALRQAIVLRLIALDRVVHAIAFSAVGAAALALRWKLNAVHGWAAGTLDALESARHGAGGVSTHGFSAALLTRLAQLRPDSLLLLALFAGAYALVSAFEGAGLWFEQRWAEYLTALATAGFLPLEVHELIVRVTFVRIGAMVVNVAILVYLVVAKHLFGVGGPVTSDEPEPLEPLPDLAPFGSTA